MAKYYFDVDLFSEIYDMPNIAMVNGAKKNNKCYEFDEDLIAERLKENQKLIQAA